MRVLYVDTLELVDFSASGLTIPHYVTASHRWVRGSETTYKDVLKERNTQKAGYKKVEAFANYMKTFIPSIKWLWIDTCCIDQRSTAEVSEAVNSVYKWYRDSVLCLAYLADVEELAYTHDDPCDQRPDRDTSKSEFEKSVWFTRGWTLQELLAPRMVIFLTDDWDVIGHKGRRFGQKSAAYKDIEIGPDVRSTVAKITGIPIARLSASSQIALGTRSANINEYMKWMRNRETTRPEDMIYALYGEGYSFAERRLLKALGDNEAYDELAMREYLKKCILGLPRKERAAYADKCKAQKRKQSGLRGKPPAAPVSPYDAAIRATHSWGASLPGNAPVVQDSRFGAAMKAVRGCAASICSYASFERKGADNQVVSKASKHYGQR